MGAKSDTLLAVLRKLTDGKTGRENAIKKEALAAEFRKSVPDMMGLPVSEMLLSRLVLLGQAGESGDLVWLL